MKLEVLVSTMNLKNEEETETLIKKMHIQGKAVVINQITAQNIAKTTKEDGSFRVYSYNEKGLSKSRNIAIDKLEADIGVIADDDVIYNEKYEETITKAYEKYPDADIIAFYVQSKNESRPIRKQKTHKVNFITAMRIRSVQITLKKESKIKFDEEFGIGSKYNRGEENIWLYDCMKSGKKVYYINEEIGEVLQKQSSWYSGMDEEFLKSEGAVFYRISKKFYWILDLQYAIRKRKYYKHNMSTIEAFKYLRQGSKTYKNRES